MTTTICRSKKEESTFGLSNGLKLNVHAVPNNKLILTKPAYQTFDSFEVQFNNFYR